MVDQTKKQVGEAYAFFDCKASLEEVHQEIGDLASNLSRDTLSKLELSLREMSDFRKSSNDIELLQALDSVPFYPIFHSEARKLKEEATPMRMKDLRYALTAKYTPGTNNDAGDALCFIMAGIYARYSDDALFLGQIVGKGPDGQYGFWGND